MYKILVINPGSTSTKIAVYENDKQVFSHGLNHSPQSLSNFETIVDQFKMRKEEILKILESNCIDINSFDAVVGRGGMLPPVKSGAYLVNEKMIEDLTANPISEHASNLGAVISYEIAKSVGINAYIYDSVAVDELSDIARVSGLNIIERNSLSHVLNSRAMAIKYAKSINKRYEDINVIVAHLGGGISLSMHEKGKMVDIISDDEGPFSPERAGMISALKLIEKCYSGEYTKQEMKKMIRGKGGIYSYLGTVDVREVEAKINDGDEYAKLIYNAMVYQVAKGIGELATVTDGNVDAIIITGGISYSQKITEMITKKVKFISSVQVYPGENELDALALGTLRVLNGEENYRIYE